MGGLLAMLNRPGKRSEMLIQARHSPVEGGCCEKLLSNQIEIFALLSKLILSDD